MHDVDTLAIDTALNKGQFYGKIMQKYPPKASTRSFFILLNSPKQPLHARNSFKNNILGKGIIKNI